MEAFVEALKAGVASGWEALVPYLRQGLRFLALPYCYFFQVNWKECKRSRLQVASDFAYIFFGLGYYPDNYGLCRFFEKDRDEWRFYFGSSYNPFQRAHLSRQLVPRRYHVLFEDKEVCHQLCAGLGVRMPRLVGVLAPNQSLAEFWDDHADDPATEVILKPASGAAGGGIYLARRGQNDWNLTGAKGERVDGIPRRKVRYLVEEVLAQHDDLNAVYPGSLNTMRVMTLLKSDGTAMVMGTTIRFGAGGNRVDNWSVGGVALRLDLATGQIGPLGLDKRSLPVDRHPDTEFVFADFRLPEFAAVRQFGERIQRGFPYFGILGLDVAMAPDGPVLIEINAFPDIAGFEQGWGPLLGDPEVLREFSRQDLLTASMRRALKDDIVRAEMT